MPLIYTKEEVDKILEEASKFTKSVDISLAQSLDILTDKITKMYNELFTMVSDTKNRLDRIDQENKEAKKAPKRETDRHDPR